MVYIFNIDDKPFHNERITMVHLNFHGDSLAFQKAVSIYDEQPQIISINKDDHGINAWSDWVEGPQETMSTP